MQTKTLESSNSLKKELDRFTVEQRRLIYQNVSKIELTTGCSNYCDFCGADSEKGVSDFIPFSVLEQIAEEMTTLTDRVKKTKDRIYKFPDLKALVLYGATDPLDYQDGHMNYFHVRQLFREKGFRISTSTAVPEGKEALAIRNLGLIDQISISHMNRERLTPFFQDLGIAVYVDVGHHLVFNHKLGYPTNILNHAIHVQGSVDETIKKLREEHPSLKQNARFYDLRIDGNKFRGILKSHEQYVLLFCADKGYNFEGRTADRDFTGVVAVGRAQNYEQTEKAMTFGIFNGVKLTPKGVFNYIHAEPQFEDKRTLIMEKVTQKRFNVVKYAVAEKHINEIERFYVRERSY